MVGPIFADDAGSTWPDILHPAVSASTVLLDAEFSRKERGHRGERPCRPDIRKLRLPEGGLLKRLASRHFMLARERCRTAAPKRPPRAGAAAPAPANPALISRCSGRVSTASRAARRPESRRSRPRPRSRPPEGGRSRASSSGSGGTGRIRPSGSRIPSRAERHGETRGTAPPVARRATATGRRRSCAPRPRAGRPRRGGVLAARRRSVLRAASSASPVAVLAVGQSPRARR